MSYVEQFEDLSDISDSVLLPSELVIARYHDPDNDMHLSLEVKGFVKVEYNGICYVDVSQFPKELKNLIKEGYIQTDTLGRTLKEPWYHSPDVCVYDSNRFEVFEETSEGKHTGNSVIVEAENSTEKDIEILLEDIAEHYLLNREDEYERD